LLGAAGKITINLSCITVGDKYHLAEDRYELIDASLAYVSSMSYMFKYSAATLKIKEVEDGTIPISSLLRVHDMTAAFAQFTGSFYNEIGGYYRTNDLPSRGMYAYMFEPYQPFQEFTFGGGLEIAAIKSNDGPVFQCASWWQYPSVINGIVRLVPRYSGTNVTGTWSNMFASTNAVASINVSLPSKGDVDFTNATKLNLKSVYMMLAEAPTVEEWTDTDSSVHTTSWLTLPAAMADTYFASAIAGEVVELGSIDELTEIPTGIIAMFQSNGWNLRVGDTAIEQQRATCSFTATKKAVESQSNLEDLTSYAFTCQIYPSSSLSIIATYSDGSTTTFSIGRRS